MVGREQNSYDRNSMLQFFETAIVITMIGIAKCRMGEPFNGERRLTFDILQMISQELVELKQFL